MLRLGTLLKQGVPGSGVLFEHIEMAILKPFRPEVVADLAAYGVVAAFALSRKTYDVPIAPVLAPDQTGFAFIVFREEAAGDILLGPARLDEYLPPPGNRRVRMSSW